MCQQKLPKLKSREKKNEKMEWNIRELWDNYKRYNNMCSGTPEGEERKEGTEEMIEVING